MKNLLIGLICLFLLVNNQNNDYYTYGPIYSGAITLDPTNTTTYIVDVPLTWVKVGELHFPKYQDDTYLLFTCQITFTKNTDVIYGNEFKLRFRTKDGIYISDTPKTGQIPTVAFGRTNCMLSDTVIDNRLGREPLAGEYVAELWAFTGGDVLNIVLYETNIMVWENPVWIRIKK